MQRATIILLRVGASSGGIVSSGQSRTIWGLAALAAVALLIVAGLVGYIAADRDGEPTPPTAVASTPTPPTPKRIPDLRQTVEKFIRDGEDSESVGSPTFHELMNTYAVPACGAIVIGLSDAFGGVSEIDPATTTIIDSVVQRETTGTSITHEGDRDPETLQWVFDGTSWRFTCEGVFDEPAEPTVEPPPALESSTPKLLSPCFEHEIGRQSGALRCSGADAYGPTRWTVVP